LALSTGAEFVSRDSTVALRDVKLQHFGQARSVDIRKGSATIIGGKGSAADIDRRIELLKIELKNTEELAECDKIQERITKLAAGVAVIKVGAPTEVEMIEKKHRIEDALEAVRSAQQEGILPGGGIALLRASEDIKVNVENDDQQYGVDIVQAAAVAPLRQMAQNCGLSPDLIEAEIRKATKNCGHNFRDFCMVDMYDAGIVDPLKVTRNYRNIGLFTATPSGRLHHGRRRCDATLDCNDDRDSHQDAGAIR